MRTCSWCQLSWSLPSPVPGTEVLREGLALIGSLRRGGRQLRPTAAETASAWPCHASHASTVTMGIAGVAHFPDVGAAVIER